MRMRASSSPPQRKVLRSALTNDSRTPSAGDASSGHRSAVSYDLGSGEVNTGRQEQNGIEVLVMTTWRVEQFGSNNAAAWHPSPEHLCDAREIKAPAQAAPAGQRRQVGGRPGRHLP